MKAVIIAAGMGRRMGDVTEALPKPLAIRWNGQSLFDYQVRTFQNCGISDIVVIRGFEGEKFTRDDVKYVWNRDYASNNILLSLMHAREVISGELIISYSDIWFEESVVKALAASKDDISVVVDRKWKDAYVGRSDHPVEEAEVVKFDDLGNVSLIGKIATGVQDADAEFIGMMKIRGQGIESFLKSFDKAQSEFKGKPFQRAKAFEKSYLTDLLQYMIGNGTQVSPCEIQGSWMEMDTDQDLKRFLDCMSSQI